MKPYSNYLSIKSVLRCFFLLLGASLLVEGGITSENTLIKSSPNPITDAGVTVRDMCHFNYRQLFSFKQQSEALGYGGIKAQMLGKNSKVEVRMFSYDEDASDGKGVEIYYVFSEQSSSEEFMLGTTRVTLLLNLIRNSSMHLATESDNLKRRAQGAKVYPAACAGNNRGVSWREMLSANDRVNLPLGGACRFARQTQPIIIEVKITNATLNEFKIPGLGVFDAERFFNFTEKTQEALRNPNGHKNFIMVAAHRGYFRHRPENSLAAIQDAIDMGVDMVEIDVRPTKDGHLVLAHDVDLGRLTTIPDHILGKPSFQENGKYLLKHMDLADIRPDLFYPLLKENKPVKLKDYAGNPHEVIPTLKEAMELCRGKVLIDVDKLEDPNDGGRQRFDLVFKEAQELAMTQQVIVKGRVGNPYVLRDNYPNVDWTQLKFTPVYFSDVVPKDHEKKNMTIYDSVISFLNNNSVNCPGVELIYRNQNDPLLGRPYSAIKQANKHVFQFPQYPERDPGVWNPKKFQFSDIDPRHDHRNDWEWLLEESRRPTLLISDRLELLLDLLNWKGLRSF